MFRNLSFAHDLARQSLADLDVVLADRLRLEHRVKRRDFPDVRNSQLQTVRQVLHSRRIEVATLSLDDEHQRQNRRTPDRVFRQMPINFRLDLRREAGRRRHVDRMIRRLNFYQDFTHRYRSISPRTISNDPMIATMSATMAPCDI